MSLVRKTKINPNIVGIMHSKFRNAIGLVGIEVLIKQQKIRVKLAKQWSRKQLDIIPQEIGALHKKYKWDYTYIDLQVGYGSIISKLRQKERMHLNVITTSKNTKDTDDIERVRVMDLIEMVQYQLLLKQTHTLEFPPIPKGTMITLENQFALFSEHKTEQGSMSYYSPGNELDNLTKALILACFAARKYLRGSTGKHFATSVNMVSGGDELGSGLSGSQMSRGRDVQWDARNRRTAARKFTIR